MKRKKIIGFWINSHRYSWGDCSLFYLGEQITTQKTIRFDLKEKEEKGKEKKNEELGNTGKSQNGVAHKASVDSI
jgi:hypothetical protein